MKNFEYKLEITRIILKKFEKNFRLELVMNKLKPHKNTIIANSTITRSLHNILLLNVLHKETMSLDEILAPSLN